MTLFWILLGCIFIVQICSGFFLELSFLPMVSRKFKMKKKCCLLNYLSCSTVYFNKQFWVLFILINSTYKLIIILCYFSIRLSQGDKLSHSMEVIIRRKSRSSRVQVAKSTRKDHSNKCWRVVSIGYPTAIPCLQKYNILSFIYNFLIIVWTVKWFFSSIFRRSKK